MLDVSCLPTSNRTSLRPSVLMSSERVVIKPGMSGDYHRPHHVCLGGQRGCKRKGVTGVPHEDPLATLSGHP
jgi:hypothetical protein